MPKPALAGARIRRYRLDRGLKQTELAAACGISPSYLNLIEHDRRPIGGKLVADIAIALGVAPEQLSAGVAANEIAALRTAAARARGQDDIELARVEEFALRFPGWAGLVAAQATRLDGLERKVEMMSDRMREDPAFAASLHNILSTVTAIRSIAGILAGDDPVEQAWQARFHRNLYEESQRLADATESLVAGFEEGETDQSASDPVEDVDTWLGNGAPLSDLEPGGAGVEALKAAARSELQSSAARALGLALLDEMAEDEEHLPAAELRRALEGGLSAPLRLADRFQLRLPRILRRLAILPELGAGLVRCDGEGSILYRRTISGFTIPRYGAAQSLWPLYAALAQPGVLVTHQTGQPDQPWDRFHLWAIAETRSDGGIEGTMLILSDEQVQRFRQL